MSKNIQNKTFRSLNFMIPALVVFASVVFINGQTNTAAAENGPDICADRQPAATGGKQSSAYVRPDSKTRLNRYLKSMFGPEALFKYVANSGINTAENSPREWGPHWDGFGKRFASNLGTGIISNTVRYGMDEALKLDSHFYRSQERDKKSRIKNALISPFTARTVEGKRVFGVSRIVGVYTGHIAAAEIWYPKRYNVGDGLKGGTISLGMTGVYNLVREFIKK